MKRLRIIACSLLFVLGIAGAAGAITFTDTQVLNAPLAEGPLAEWFYPTSITYQHLTPADFEVPWDTVTGATLAITAFFANGDNDPVLTGTGVNLNFVGNLNDNGFWGWADPYSLFDISSTFNTWATGSPLDITIASTGVRGDWILLVCSSTFTLNYENGSAPVPEPATLLLLGAGLAGVGFFGRRRIKG